MITIRAQTDAFGARIIMFTGKCVMLLVSNQNERNDTMKTVIGIAGGSASGKSTFCGKLEEKLSDYRVKVLHMDDYFRPEQDRPYVASHLNGKYYVDDNCPDTIDFDQYHRDLDSACSQEYDIIILEGLLVLWDIYAKEKLDIRIFVDCRPAERIVRRVKRNMQWGQTFDQITEGYLNMVRFRHDQYVEPSKWTADFIVNGTGDTNMICKMCTERARALQQR